MKSDISENTYSELRESVKEFCEKRISPIAKAIDEEDQFPIEIFRELGKMGYLGITIPEEYGGAGLDLVSQGIIQEEIGYVSASLALSYGAHSNLCLDSVYRNGSQHIRDSYVRKLVSGEWIGSLCLTEPGSGSDALSMSTRAERVDGGYVINGSKTLITNAPYANLFLVYARDGDRYTSFVVLDTDKGVRRGNKFNKMGMRGSPTGEVFFDNVFVPDDRVLGKPGEGLKVILSGLNAERAVLATLFVGIARRALDAALDYAISRKQGGRPIGDYELIQEKLAYMYTKVETSKMLSYRALRQVQNNPMDSLNSAASIMYAAEVSEYVSREALQIHGGIGYTRDMVVERLLRDSILGQIGAGTTEIRKRVISKALVKRYKEGWKP